MTSQPWADTPFDLITTPSSKMDLKSHGAVHCASEMAHSHNTLIRGLNSLYQQGAYVRSKVDVQDYLTFCLAWVKMVHLHHHSEETILFPALKEFLGDDSTIVDSSLEEHHAFEDGLHRFEEYVQNTSPDQYNWTDLKELIDSFAPVLLKHLYTEIDSVLALRKYDSDKLLQIWQSTEDAAKAATRPFNIIIPCVLGCADRTYEGGIHQFPPPPFFVPWLVHYWLAAKYRGAWRFCPCDFWGNPRPLQFVE